LRSIWATKCSGAPFLSFGQSKSFGAFGFPPIHDVALSDGANGD
jgi:hypothetical protein